VAAFAGPAAELTLAGRPGGRLVARVALWALAGRADGQSETSAIRGEEGARRPK